jgi:hypothetical protein
MNKEQLYEWLGKKFETFNRNLSPEEQTTLDGLLWEVAGQLAEEKGIIYLTS